MTTVKNIIVLSRRGAAPATSFEVAGEYEALLEKKPGDYDFPDFDENSMATTFYTTGTTGAPKGVCFSHRQLVLHTLATAASAGQACQGFCLRRMSTCHLPPCFMSTPGDFLTCLHARRETGLSGTLHTRDNPWAYRKGRRDLFPLRSDHSAYGARPARFRRGGFLPIEDHRWRRGPFQGIVLAALKKGINVYAGYRMSETCPVLTIADLKPHMSEWNEEEQLTFAAGPDFRFLWLTFELSISEGGISHVTASVSERLW